MKIKFTLLMAAAITVTACSNEAEHGPNIKDNATTIDICIEANQDSEQSPMSKAAFKGDQFEWRKGDELIVKSADGQATLTMSGAEYGNSTTFEGKIAVSGPQYIHAVQRGRRTDATTTFENTSYTFKQVALQQQNHFSTASGSTIDHATVAYYTYMYGKSTSQVDAATPSTSIAMKHVTAIMDFEISNLPADKVANELIIESSNPMASAVTIDIDNGNATQTEIGISTFNAKLSTAGKAGIISPSGNLTVRLALLPQTITQGTAWKLKLVCEDETLELSKEFSQDLTLEGGALYPAPITFHEDLFEGVLDESLITREHIATASYEREFTIPVNATSPWSATELKDDKGGFEIIYPAEGTQAQAGENLVIKVSENSNINKIYNAEYRVETADGKYDKISLKQANAIATSPFVQSQWTKYNAKFPTFEDGKVISQDQWAVRASTRSIKLELSSFISGNGLQFMAFSKSSSGATFLSGMMFEVGVWANTIDCKWASEKVVGATVAGLVTADEKATFEVIGAPIVKSNPTHTFEIMAYPTPQGYVWTLFANGQFVTEVDPEITNRVLAGGLSRSMFKGAGPNAVTALTWGESTLSYNDAQWSW